MIDNRIVAWIAVASLIICTLLPIATGVRYYPKKKPDSERVLHHPKHFMLRLTRVGGKDHMHSKVGKTVDEGYDLKALGFGINRYRHGGIIGRLSTAWDSANSPYAPGKRRRR
ncbi:uncharacterized protein LOC129584072 [Paramacrobiotus metropolitanus]|uniref:uncharacterized protein LOC129584072 n=1 Tax=Paramacrobiotus metropolitanus TaxID=2943436 RepID=UPI0024461E56|nr:uncharacterized protein LOC129584072 [Paramacrobiotus metropolitanus]